jgi:hypothetical protein
MDGGSSCRHGRDRDVMMISRHLLACAIALLAQTDHIRATNERIVHVLRLGVETRGDIALRTMNH